MGGGNEHLVKTGMGMNREQEIVMVPGRAMVGMLG